MSRCVRIAVVLLCLLGAAPPLRIRVTHAIDGRAFTTELRVHQNVQAVTCTAGGEK